MSNSFCHPRQTSSPGNCGDGDTCADKTLRCFVFLVVVVLPLELLLLKLGWTINPLFFVFLAISPCLPSSNTGVSSGDNDNDDDYCGDEDDNNDEYNGDDDDDCTKNNRLSELI